MSRSSKVADKVMLLHEKCLQGNYDMVSKLQIACSTVQPTFQCKKVINDDVFATCDHS